jgi:hypothetical protein
MADRAMAYCPDCRANGNPTVEAMRDNVDCFCVLGHKQPHAAFWAKNPDMIKTEVHFKPGPHDMKAEIWVNAEVLTKAKQALGERFHPTIASLIRACMAGEPVLIDGVQAAELRKLGVRNGAEMLATAKLNLELAGQNENLVEQVNRWENMAARAMTSV